MAATITDIDALNSYMLGVMQRAGHHARGVEEVCLPLVGAVMWRKDPDTHLEVRTRLGEVKNVISVVIGGTRYVLKYNHHTGAIELRRGTQVGTLVASFANGTSPAYIKEVFETL